MDLKLNPNPKQCSKLKAPEESLYSNFKTELYLFLFDGPLNLRGYYGYQNENRFARNACLPVTLLYLIKTFMASTQSLDPPFPVAFTNSEGPAALSVCQLLTLWLIMMYLSWKYCQTPLRNWKTIMNSSALSL